MNMLSVKEKVPMIKPTTSTVLSIPEPSDIATDGQYFYMVSDRGLLYKTELNGKVISKSNFNGVDYEALCVVGDQLIVSDEGSRKIYYFNKQSLKKKKEQ